MKKFTNPYLACLAAGFFSFYDIFQFTTFNVISIPLLATFHLNTFTLGLFSSSFLISNVIGLIVLGFVTDRYLARKVALIFLGIATLSTFGFAYSHSIVIDIICRSFQGIASGASLLVCIRTTTEWFSDNPSFAVGATMAIALAGGVAGNLLFANFVAYVGWRNALVATGFLGVLIWLFVYRWLHSPRHIQDQKNPLNFSDLKAALFNVKNIFAGLYLGLMSAPIFVLATLWGNYYLIQVYHATATKAAFFSSLFFIGLMLSSSFWGYVANRFMTQQKAMLLGCSMVILLNLLLFSGQCSLDQVGILFFGIGFFSNVQNLAYVVVFKSNPSHVVSTATSLTAILLNTVGALLQPLFGYVLTFTTPVHAGFVLFLPAFLICFVLIILMHDRGSSLVGITQES